MRRPASPAAVVAAARGWIGTPYAHQQSTRGVGCDCLGLARGVWREVVGPEPTTIPPYTSDWGEVGAREVLRDGALAWMIPAPLDLRMLGTVVLFRMRPGAPAKHVGILTGPGAFVHAYERTGVIEERLAPRWAQRIAYACTYPAGG